jgi:hypothetical protein
MCKRIFKLSDKIDECKLKGSAVVRNLFEDPIEPACFVDSMGECDCTAC